MHIEQVLNSGNFCILNPGKEINNAFLKVNPNRTRIERFKENLIEFPIRTNDTKFADFHKNQVLDSLKKIYYEINHFIIKLQPEINRLGCRLYGFIEE